LWPCSSGCRAVPCSVMASSLLDRGDVLCSGDSGDVAWLRRSPFCGSELLSFPRLLLQLLSGVLCVRLPPSGGGMGKRARLPRCFFLYSAMAVWADGGRCARRIQRWREVAWAWCKGTRACPGHDPPSPPCHCCWGSVTRWSCAAWRRGIVELTRGVQRQRHRAKAGRRAGVGVVRLSCGVQWQRLKVKTGKRTGVGDVRLTRGAKR
jgi:hypothetical protein